MMSNFSSLVFKEMQLCVLTNEGAVDQPHRKAGLLCCKQKAEEKPPNNRSSLAVFSLAFSAPPPGKINTVLLNNKLQARKRSYKFSSKYRFIFISHNFIFLIFIIIQFWLGLIFRFPPLPTRPLETCWLHTKWLLSWVFHFPFFKT